MINERRFLHLSFIIHHLSFFPYSSGKKENSDAGITKARWNG
jgi:hypothetical protein